MTLKEFTRNVRQIQKDAAMAITMGELFKKRSEIVLQDNKCELTLEDGTATTLVVDDPMMKLIDTLEGTRIPMRKELRDYVWGLHIRIADLEKMHAVRLGAKGTGAEHTETGRTSCKTPNVRERVKNVGAGSVFFPGAPIDQSKEACKAKFDNNEIFDAMKAHFEKDKDTKDKDTGPSNFLGRPLG